MSTQSGVETEVKLLFSGTAQEAVDYLLGHGFTESVPRVFEGNDVYDTPDQALRARGELIRLREAGGRYILTWKGKSIPGVHKSRPESEVEVSSFGEMKNILVGLGYQLTFRYEKYRTEFRDAGGQGTATVDETPIGIFLELEGPPDWIDRTATQIGLTPKDYVTLSYAGLYLEHCRQNLISPFNMVFAAAPETT